MWVKICATTNLEDARLAADAGADALGFIFARSPRQVTAEEVAAITPQLSADVTLVGVFQTHDFDEIASAVERAGLHGIQLHSDPDPMLVERLRGEFGQEQFLIQTLHSAIDGDPAEADRVLRKGLRTVAGNASVDVALIDARTATASGGTGKTVDWSRTREAIEAEAGRTRIILAGGLRPENVAEAIRTLRPWGVDVTSGVELQPGKKDPARVRAFILAARAAFAALENPAGLPV